VWAPKLGAKFKFPGSPPLTPAAADVFFSPPLTSLLAGPPPMILPRDIGGSFIFSKPPPSENREDPELLLRKDPEDSSLAPMLNVGIPARAGGIAEDCC